MIKRLPLLASLGVLATTAVLGVAPAQAGENRVVGHAYVNDNTAGVNTVAVFDRHSDGSMTAHPGSPFAIGGAGAGAGLGSQGAIQATADGRYLVAVDAGSNQLSVLRVGWQGVPAWSVSRSRPEGSDRSASPSRPMGWSTWPTSVTAAATTPASGCTTTVPSPPSRAPQSRCPRAQVSVTCFFNSTADRLVGTRDNTSLIDSFTVRRDGRLVAAVGSPFAAQSLGPIGAEFRPTDPSQLFVSNAHAGAGLGTVSAFKVSRRGVLTAVGVAVRQRPDRTLLGRDQPRRPLPVLGQHRVGHDLQLRIAPDGSLTLVANTPLRVGQGAVDARVSPDGSTLSVTGGSGHVLTTFSVHGGDLAELASSPVALPADATPTGLVVL